MLAVGDGMPVVGDETLVVGDETLAIGDEMLVPRDEMPAVDDGMLAIEMCVLTNAAPAWVLDADLVQSVPRELDCHQLDDRSIFIVSAESSPPGWSYSRPAARPLRQSLRFSRVGSVERWNGRPGKDFCGRLGPSRGRQAAAWGAPS
jgi:hypothetical protein